MFTSRLSRKFLWLLSLSLLGALLVACGGSSASSSSGRFSNLNNLQAGSAGQPGGGHISPLSTPMPVTQTNCPSSLLSGRQPVMRPMSLGKDATVVYISDQGVGVGPNSDGEIKLYDTVTGVPVAGSKIIPGKSVLVHLPDALISEAQVSANGQWVLFVTQAPGVSEIQMVRMDGQGLQTLYCALPGTIHGVQWSPDTSRFIFSQEAISGLWNLSLFDITTGVVQPELVQLNGAPLGYEARTWLDNERVYVIGMMNAYPPALFPGYGLFVLDTSKGSHQKPSDLLQIMKPSQSLACRSFDSDYNTTVLITSACHQTVASGSSVPSMLAGPSSIVAQAVTGGSPRTIYTSQQQAVTQVRMLGHESTTMLVTISTIGALTGSLSNTTATQNGLWKMNLDGSGRTSLFTSDAFSECEFNQFTQYPWSNISLDNRLYSIEVHQILGKSSAITLQVGSLSGDSSSSVAFENGMANQGLLAIAGWTSM